MSCDSCHYVYTYAAIAMGGNDDRENSMHTVSILSAHIAIGGKDCKKINEHNYNSTREF